MQVFVNFKKMIQEQKQKTLVALKKATTSLNKVIKMTEDERYCIDIIQQVLAAQGLLKSAQNSLLENHFNCCFKEAFDTKNKNKQDELIAELLRVLKISQKK